MVSPRCCQGYRSVSTTVMGCCHGNLSCCCEDCGGIFPRKRITCNMCTHILTRVHLQSHGYSQRALRTDRSKSTCMQEGIYTSARMLLLYYNFYIEKGQETSGTLSVSKLLNMHTWERHGQRCIAEEGLSEGEICWFCQFDLLMKPPWGQGKHAQHHGIFFSSIIHPSTAQCTIYSLHYIIIL